VEKGKTKTAKHVRVRQSDGEKVGKVQSEKTRNKRAFRKKKQERNPWQRSYVGCGNRIGGVVVAKGIAQGGGSQKDNHLSRRKKGTKSRGRNIGIGTKGKETFSEVGEGGTRFSTLWAVKGELRYA